MVHDVFISYSAKNKAVADAITAKLENMKIRTWIAPRDILPGEDWGESIINAIEKSKIFIIILTKDSNQSKQVIREVERAVSMGIPIIPFRVEDVELSKSLQYFLSTTHWLDALTPPLEQHIDKLADIVHVLKNTMEGKGTETEKQISEELINKYSPTYKTESGYNKRVKILGGIISIVGIFISSFMPLSNITVVWARFIGFIFSFILLLLVIKPDYINKIFKSKFNIKKFYTPIIISLIILVLSTIFIGYSPVNTQYSEMGSGINYKVPPEFNKETPAADEMNSFYMITRDNQGREYKYQFKVYKEKISSLIGQYDEKNAVLMKDSGYSNIIEKNVTVAGFNAIDHIYIMKSFEGNIKYREIWIQQDKYLYRLLLKGPENKFDFYNREVDKLLQNVTFI